MPKTVLITGCSSGFGEACVKRFAQAGWNVVATMRRPEVDSGLASLPGVMVIRLDVQDDSSIEDAVRSAIAKFGTLDVVVNNAGFGLFGIFEATSREKICEQFDVNLFGVMNVVRATLPHFRQKRSGLFINVSSGAGVFGLPMISLYNASKFALEGFSESLSYELAALGIGVKIIEPGGVLDTRFTSRSGTELSQISTPSEYANFVTATGKIFDGLRHARGAATSEGVAEVIFTAATDGKEQLRYVATDDIRPLIAKRRESSEEEYMAFMRERMSPNLKSIP